MNIKEFADIMGVKYCTMLARWQKAGRPDVLTDELARDSTNKRHTGRTFTFEGRLVTMPDFAKEFGLDYSTVHYRWCQVGRPDELTRALVSEVFKTKRPKRRVGMSMDQARGVKLTDLYSNPNYLPHVPHGDLAHLSDKVNTGAARQGLAEVW